MTPRRALRALALAGALGGAAVPHARAQALEAPPSALTWAEVATTPHMHFAAVPHGAARIVLAWGGIGQGDAARFAEALRQAGPIDEVQFFSPGGLLDEGLQMGYTMRARGLAARVPRGARCASACNFAFMGGVIRSIDPGAQFEVHMFANGVALADEVARDVRSPPTDIAAFNNRFPDTQLDPAAVQAVLAQRRESLGAFLRERTISEEIKLIQQYSAKTAAKIGQFLLRMQLSLDFLTEFADIPNDTPRPLTPEQLRRFNVVND
ncbi:MAG: hypothetical protein M0Z28_08750 [Rhodospirillales bacterium]|nr:hypothetical protein [Rhodospirillales bacterium]